MSQELQYPQAQYGTNTSMGRGQTGQRSNVPLGQQGLAQLGQYGQQTSQFGQQVSQFQSGGTFAESVPNEVVTAVQELDRLETVTEWAHTRAMEKNLHQVAKLCDDLAMIAHFEKALIVRNSPLAGIIGNATKQSIQTTVNQLQQFGSDPEINEVITVAQRSVATIDDALNRLSSIGQSVGQGGAPSSYGGFQESGSNVGYGQQGSYSQMRR